MLAYRDSTGEDMKAPVQTLRAESSIQRIVEVADEYASHP